MQHLLRLLSFLLFSILLISCASTEKHDEDSLIDKTASYKYAAWRVDNAQQSEAIYGLLGEADALIESSNFDAATDKLERVLRIKAEYAPAWSRLSWIALQTDVPKRSIEMAKRSNSFAHGDTKLQLLNWTFISTASKTLNDEDLYLRANQEINSLTSF